MIILLPFLLAMFLAANMGASGTAPSFSAAYGAGLIRKELIPGLFGVFVLLGALVAGDKVLGTIGNDILPANNMDFTVTSIILVSVSLSMLLANLLAIPQSTSQATVFALVGPALYFGVLKSERLLWEIIPLWFLLPVIAFLLTYGIGKLTYPILQRRNGVRFDQLFKHPVLHWMVIGAALYVAFSIGSNNVANAAGPIFSLMVDQMNVHANSSTAAVLKIASMLIVAPCFGIGASFFSDKLVKTTGKEIVEFGPWGALLISLVTATLLLLASITKGIPTSLVQMNVASIIALGIVKGQRREMLNKNTFRRMFFIWLIAPVIAFALSYALTWVADSV